MDLIIWIIFGAFVGWAAGRVMGTGGGLLWDIVVGIVGSVIGGFLINGGARGGSGGVSVYGFIVSLLGACIFIAIARALRKG